MAPSRRLGAVFAVVAALLSACAAGPATVDPSGVDGLEIPTPTPDPTDFIEGIDNPYLPLQPGNEWVYEVTGDQPGTITVTVTDETREVAGVTTTVVRDIVTDADGEVIEETSDWFAQDADGNVWHFGSSGSWEAGVDGAQAGLAMAATPRVGDGYQQEFDDGEAEDRAEVLALDESLQLGSGSYDSLLVTEDTTPLAPDLVERTYYARGTGLVYEETITGGTEQVELVSFTEG
ncbi:MAG: hypothetical protein WKF50_02005 [Nocardioides sp.]